MTSKLLMIGALGLMLTVSACDNGKDRKANAGMASIASAEIAVKKL